MTTAKFSAYGSTTTVLSTEMNSLANSTLSAAGTAYDNSTNLYPLADIELVIATMGVARSSGGAVIVYRSVSATGTTQDNTVESQQSVGFPLDAATTARTHTKPGSLSISSVQKFTAFNATGQALAAASNTVKVVPYTLTMV